MIEPWGGTFTPHGAMRENTRMSVTAVDQDSGAHRPPRSPRLGRRARLRLAFATGAGRLAAAASRLTRRGAGGSVPGRVMLTLDPGALAKLLATRRVAIVSGTNGKTTTTHLLAAAIRSEVGDHRVVHNADGANLQQGILTAVATNPGADLAVLETDERVVPDMLRVADPQVLVLLNVSPDQLDRHHEITALAQGWRDALDTAGTSAPAVVANANDPWVVWATAPADRVVWIDTAATGSDGTTQCPECGGWLAHTEDAGDTTWHCRSCSFGKPDPDYRVADDTVVDPQGHAWEPDLGLPGQFNIDNAASALAAAHRFGVSSPAAWEGMRHVSSPAGRYATARFGDATARLFLAKNPAGWAALLPVVDHQVVILAIDAQAADGRDLSWLWDVCYEQLAGHTVIATGPRAHDLAVRLRYAEVDYRLIPDLAAATSGHSGHVDVVSTYTPFQHLQAMDESA